MRKNGLLSTAQAARLLLLDEESVRRAIREKRLRAIKRGRRFLIPAFEVARYRKRKGDDENK